MINKTHYYLIIMILSLLACNNDTKKQTSKYLFENSKNISFKNDDSYFYSFLSNNKTENSEIYRRRIRSSKEGIDVIDFNNTNQKREIVFNEEIMRNLKKFRSFVVKNSDSIYLLGINKILMINDSSDLLNEQYFNNPKEDNYFPITGSNNSKAFILNNNIYFTKIIDQNPDNELYKQNTLLKYNINTGELKELKNTNYPKSYYDRCWFSVDLEVNYALNNNNQLVYSFPIDDNLYVYSLNSNKIESIKNCKSSYKNNDVEKANCDLVWDVKSYHKHSYNSFLYTDIVFDNYRNIYYRFGIIPAEEYNTNEKFNSLNREFIITVLDRNLNLIHESRVFNEDNQFIVFDYFVNKEGLWISSNNPDNKNYDEDFLNFSLFNLKKLK